MKKIRRITLCILILTMFICALTPLVASADSLQSNNENQYTSPKGYFINSLSTNGKINGVEMYGEYFGHSRIRVVSDIYSQQGLTIDFSINASESKLTETQIATRNKLIEICDGIHDLIVEVDNCANTQYDGKGGSVKSDIYRYNNESTVGQPLKIDKHTYQMLLIAKEMYNATNGAFNPAVYRLVDLWGFSSRIYSNGDFYLPYDRPVTSTEFVKNGYPLPEQKYIDAFSNGSFTDFSDNAVKLTADSDGYYVTKYVADAVVENESYSQWIDLGGIAKGYVADLIKIKLDSLGIYDHHVNAGSSSLVIGQADEDSTTNLGLNDPYYPFYDLGGQPNDLIGIAVGKVSVSTSGQYVRKYTTDGVQYAHIIDGSRGAPAQTGVKSVMIVAPEGNFWAGKSDCLTTALTVLGRDGIVQYMNGYLKDNGIKVYVVYESVDGTKHFLSNASQDEIIYKDESFDEYAWSITCENGVYAYDYDAQPPKTEKTDYLWLYITLGVLACAGVIGIIVYHYLKGKKKACDNIVNAKRDKPFKIGDIGVYLIVLIVIAALFVGFFGGDNTEQSIKLVHVVDMSRSSAGEIIFTYNAMRNEWIVYDDNSSGWKIEAKQTDGGAEIRFSREIDGEQRYNVVTISRGSGVSVKMSDSVCGYHQECVRNFPAITRPNASIVCSPNSLKIVSE